jgi:hypothetical protein
MRFCRQRLRSGDALNGAHSTQDWQRDAQEDRSSLVVNVGHKYFTGKQLSLSKKRHRDSSDHSVEIQFLNLRENELLIAVERSEGYVSLGYNGSGMEICPG